MPPRFGTDGLRGVANVDLTPELVVALGRAVARHLSGETFIVGRDTRRSGPMLFAALAAGLAAEGSRVEDVGVLPTPGVAWLAADRRQPAAVISASHNPFQDNGIKLLSPEGSKLPDALERAIEVELDALIAPGMVPGPSPSGATLGEIVADTAAVDSYIEHLVSVAGFAGRSLRVVLDCANGAAAAVAPEVLKRLGMRATVLFADPNGTNINDGCGSTDPRILAARVVEEGADLGLCFDGDADRLIAVDDHGGIVDGDRLIALFAGDLASRGELNGNGVVVTVMSNLGLRRALEQRGITTLVTPVGDRSVVVGLEESGFVLGGEQSGHIVFRREATTGDGILSGLRLIGLLERAGRPLSELASGVMERFPQELRTIHIPQPTRINELDALIEEVARIEGELGDLGRVLVRASGTEAAVRVMVEADRADVAIAAAERLVDVIRRGLSAD